MAYIGNSPGVASQRVVTTFTATAGQTTFTPSSGYTLGYCDVFYNGVKLVNGDDYTASNGTSVVLASAAAAGDSVEIVAHFPRGLSDGYLKSEADARYPRVDTASQGLNSTQQSNARTNIGAQAALGYTPVNRAGDTITGRTIVSVATGKQLTVAQWGDASSADGGQTMLAGNAYFDKTGGQAKFSNSHGTIGAVGVRFNSPSWNQGSLFTSGSAGSTADATFTPLDSLIWDSSGRITTPNQPYFYANIIENSTKSSASGSTVVRYTNVRDSNGIGHGYNTSNGVFTAPVSGVYAFTWVYLMQGLTAGALIDDGYVWRDQFVFGGNRFKNNEPITNGDGYIAVKGSAVVKLPANDTFYVRCSLSGLTGNWNFYGDTNWGYLQGMLIG